MSFSSAAEVWDAINNAESVQGIINTLKQSLIDGIKLDATALTDLVHAQSVSVDNTQAILLYSGALENTERLPDGTEVKPVFAWQVAESIGATHEGVATIGQTDAHALLSSPEFNNAYKFSVGEIRYAAEVNGTDINGVRINHTSLWDSTSIRLIDTAAEAAGTEGLHIKTITPFALDDRVFAESKLPKALNDTRVATIDGILCA